MQCVFNLHGVSIAGDLKANGIVLPLSREIYKPMLKRLRAEGLTTETTSTIM